MLLCSWKTCLRFVQVLDWDPGLLNRGAEVITKDAIYLNSPLILITSIVTWVRAKSKGISTGYKLFLKQIREKHFQQDLVAGSLKT